MKGRADGDSHVCMGVPLKGAEGEGCGSCVAYF